jgi:hypothetical protein
MQDLTAKRTLVKSPPELWNELSEVERLAKHLDAFGEIKITKLEPEHTVAWEGEGASGTVSIEPSGWGTKVTLTAHVEPSAPAPAPAEEPEAADPPDARETAATEEAPEAEPPTPEAPPEPEPEPDPDPDPEAPPRRGLFARLFGRRTVPPVEPAAAPAEQPEPAAEAGEPAAEPAEQPEPTVEQPEPVAEQPEPAPSGDRDAQAILDDVLDALGSAHHRPFSRG